MSIAIIIPYRNRETQLKEFEDYFKEYLKGHDYKIFVIEQSEDGLKFNRGILLNIGFKFAFDYDTFIYHDVDLLPSDELKQYYTGKYDQVVHIASPWNRYNNTGANTKYIGGITRIPKEIFMKIGGFPSLYWGWGGEDDEVYMRLLYNKLDNIIRPTKGTITDLENLTLVEKLSFLKTNDLKCMKKYEINNFYNVRRSLSEFVLIDNLPRLLSGLENSGYTYKHTSSGGGGTEHYLVDISGPTYMCNDKELAASLLSELRNSFAYGDILKNAYYSNFTTRKFISGLDLLAKEAKHGKQSEDESIVSSINPEFKWFSQSIFHAGSEKQFLEYSNLNRSDPKYTKIMTTFKYLFYELKKGLYIQIKDGIIHVFLPFSNADYTNTWSSNLRVPPKYRRGQNEKIDQNLKKIIMNSNTPSIVAYSIENDAYELGLNKTSINPNVESWYANNYMFRNTLYNNRDEPDKFGHIDEGDKSIYLFLKFFVEFVYSRKVPDCHLFINPRDMPVHKKNLSHPYPALYPKNTYTTENIRLQNLYNNSDILPIFSGATTDEYADIPMPTDDDIKNWMWTPASNPSSVEWSSKKNIAFFRGSATGQYIDLKNQRLQAAYLSKVHPAFLDCGIVSFNKRLKVQNLGECGYINTGLRITGHEVFGDSNYPTFQIKDLKKDRVEMIDQVKYKYLVDIRGHSAAYRLPTLLSLGSVILKVDSPFKMFSEQMLKGLYHNEITVDNVHEVHYVKIRVNNGIIVEQDLINSIKFLRINDNIAQIIANNAVEYHKKYINRDHMFDYMLNLL